jgi:hypothetical protein
VLAKRVHRHANARGFDARAIGANTDTDVVIDDPLDGDQDFHGLSGKLPVSWQK